MWDGENPCRGGKPATGSGKIKWRAQKKVYAKNSQCIIGLLFEVGGLVPTYNTNTIGLGDCINPVNCQICNTCNTQFIVRSVSQSSWLSTGSGEVLINMKRCLN